MNPAAAARVIRRPIATTFAVAVALATLAVGAAWGQAPARNPLLEKVSSLALVPDDVSFYSVLLRNREQLDILLGSKAWAKFKSMPLVQAAWGKIEKQWQKDSLANFVQLLELPENRQLLDLLADMVSSEVFIYGDEQLGLSLELFNDAMNSMQLAQVSQAIQKLRGGDSDEPQALAQGRAVLDELADNLDAVEMPTLVVGFKVSDRQAAQAQLKRLEVLSRIFLGQSPDLANRFSRGKIGEGDYLTLTLDGGMVPWDQIPLEQLAGEPGQYDALAEKLRRLKLVINIGLHKDFLLLSIAKSTDHLAKLGSGELLVANGELAKAEKFAGERLTSIGYMSDDFVARMNGTPEDLDNIPAFVEELIDNADLDEDLETSILSDVKMLADDLKSLVPEPGASLSFSFLTASGIESYSYSWTQSLDLVGGKALDLLEHVGGSPLGAAVMRSRVSVDEYEMLVKWVKIGWGYVTRLAIPTMDEADREQFDVVAEKLLPLVGRLHEVTKEKLLPSLADGQFALVLDGRWKSRQWLKVMPQAAEPMPLTEHALVLGVSDAKLFKSALGDYLAIVDDALARIRELNPQALPASVKVPLPDEAKTADGETFAYSLPDEAGADPQIVLNMGLGQHAAVFSLSLDHTQRLLKATPFAGLGPLADAKQPRAEAVYLNWAGVVDVAAPWLEWLARENAAELARAATQAIQSGDDDDEDAAAPDAAPAKGEIAIDEASIVQQVRDAISILKTLRTVTISGEIDGESGSVARHVEARFQDLP